MCPVSNETETDEAQGELHETKAVSRILSLRVGELTRRFESRWK